MVDDDAGIDRAVADATAEALRKLRDASLDVTDAVNAVEHRVGFASWGSLSHELARRRGYGLQLDELAQALDAVRDAIGRAEEECRRLRAATDR